MTYNTLTAVAAAAGRFFENGLAERGGLFLGPTNLSRWKAARARVTGATGQARLAFIGGSSTQGLGANSANSGTNGSKENAYPAVVARTLQSQGINARSDGIFGDNNATDAGAWAMALYDPRNTFGGNWNRAQNNEAIAGNPIYNGPTTPDTATWALAVAVSFDTIEIFYSIYSGGGQFTVNVDGGAALTNTVTGLAYVATTGTAGFGVARFTVARGTHTINIQRNGTGGQARIVKLETYDSTLPAVLVGNCGSSGAATANILNTTSTTATKLQMLFSDANAWKPDLSYILLGNNDAINSVTVPTFKTNMRTIIDAALTTGDVILGTQMPMASSVIALTTQAQFRQAVVDLAAEYGLLCMDNAAIVGSYIDGVALGKTYDTIHYNKLAHFDQGSALGRLLARV